MKHTLILLSFSLALVACGGKNQSGRPELQSNLELEPVTHQEDIGIRREFMKAGRRLLTTYEKQFRNEFGDQRFEAIKLNFRRENIEVSDDILMNGGGYNSEVRSINHGYRLVMYTGNKRPDLSWKTTFADKSGESDFQVMHEMIELAGFDDSGMYHTKRILGRQQRPDRRR